MFEPFETIRREQIESPNSNKVYLDCAGTPLPRRDMVMEMAQACLDGGLGNPHSSAGAQSTVERTRREILEFFGAVGPGQSTASALYDVIFVSGTTAALKLVGECFPWTEDSIFCYASNSHTSVLGVRSYSPAAACFSSDCLYETLPVDCCQSVAPQELSNSFNLIALPAEDNFSGSKVDISTACSSSRLSHCIQQAQWIRQSVASPGSPVLSTKHWLSFLDTAKYASTTPINLLSIPEANRPHFLAVSFYKIFGYPTGIGALLVRQDINYLLQKKYFGGGTVDAIAAQHDYVVYKSIKANQQSIGHLFEDGTVNFHGIMALRVGFDYIQRMGGMVAIHQYSFNLTNSLYSRLQSLTHSNGQRLMEFYGYHYQRGLNDMATQGPVIAFNLYWANQKPIGYDLISRLAEIANIHFRTGCFCNPGSCQSMFRLELKDVINNFESGRICGGSDDNCDILNNKFTGAIRVSLSYCNVPEDCERLVQFFTSHFLNRNSLYDSLEMDHSSVSKESIRFTIADIIVYPIKSCKGWAVSTSALTSWRVMPYGFYLDREWAVIDKKTKRAMTQKNFPVLAQVEIEMDLIQQLVIVSHPRVAEVLFLHLSIPASVTLTATPLEDVESIKLCGRSQQSIATYSLLSASRDCPSDGQWNTRDADEWFSRLFDGTVDCHLARTCHDLNKTFSNEAQLLLLSQQSIDSFNEIFRLNHLTSPSPDERDSHMPIITHANFRPNLLISSSHSKPHQEDTLRDLYISTASSTGGKTIHYRATGPCSRCAAVNVNDKTGSVDRRVLHTLELYRKYGYRTNFGQFLELDSSQAQSLVDGNEIILMELNGEVQVSYTA